jgi:hypothetical protein
MKKRNAILKHIVILAGILLANSVYSQQTAVKNDTTKLARISNLTFELSFGSSVLFISTDQQGTIYRNGGIVVPTSALLFFAEFRPMKRMRVPVFFNLPTESKQFLVNGVIVNEKANPTFGAGLEFRFAQFGVSEKTRIELEAGPLASCIVAKG